MSRDSTTREPIAIVGVSALFPGSLDATGFWRDILAGKDLIGDVPASHWLVDDYFDADPTAQDKTYARRGGFLKPVDFDALGFGIPPSTMPATDTSQLLALIVAQQVLEDVARTRIDSMDRSRISVILGVTSAQELLFSMVSRLQKPVWVKALRETGLAESEVQAACARIADNYVPWQEASFPGLLGNVVAGRIANRLNLGGTNCVTDAACASSFSALAMAVNELQMGDSDLVITGGVDTLNDIFMYMCFSKTPALSPSGDCRPFSQQADGTMLGEGLGMVALKRLADAERDGDRVYAVLKGVGTSSDGRSKSVYAPVSEGQAKALARAYAQAGYGPETVELMEAHGTGTKAGDVAEFEGLRQVFDASGRTDRQWCALGSVKSQIGHTKAAAGAAGLFKIVMALHQKVLPPTIKVDAPNPKLALDASPFHLNTEARPWVRNADHPRRASVSAFGFGGSNFHLTLEEYAGAGRAERLPTQSHELIVVSADAVAALCDALSSIASAPPSVSLITAAFESRQVFRAALSHRAALVLGIDADWRAACTKFATQIHAAPTTPIQSPDGTSYGFGMHDGQVAFLFPGQGSQYVGMGADLAMQFDVAAASHDRVAGERLDGDTTLSEIMFPRPVFTDEARKAQTNRITATEWAQPALASASLATLGVLRDLGVTAAAHAGHSFGELTAAHAAGAFDATTLIRLARARGVAMAQAASTDSGAMLAVSASRAEVEQQLRDAAIDVSLANHNAPNQIVLSGSETAIAAAEQCLTAARLGTKRLPVATAFHSPIVASACGVFAGALAAQTIIDTQTALYANLDATRTTGNADSLRQRLAAQIAAPVRFVEMVEAMYADGCRTFIEVGPGSVLTGLVSAILKGQSHHAIATDRRQKPGVESLLMALSRLAALGVPMQIERLFADVRRDAPAIRAGKMPLKISGANYGKPYPPVNPADLPKPNPERVVSATVVSPAPVAESNVMTPPPNTPAPINAEWLRVFQETQQKTAEAHAAFQQAMAENHHAFLRVTESTLNGMNALIGVTGVPQGSSPATAFQPAPMPTVAAFVPVPVVSVPVVTAPTITPPAAVAPVVAAPPVVAAAAPPRAAIDLNAVLMQVVAEKTGYPTDMLKLDMDLEGDLGIDSIKRVEILAAIEERAALTSRPDRQRLSSLHTLGEILAEFAPLIGTAAPVAATAQTTPAAANIVATASTTALPARSIVLAVVADKTGYPVDMLQPAMDLEGDLGIDSIKRVEILAAIEDKAPALAGADRARLAAMHTLAEIIDYLDELAPTTATAAVVAPVPQSVTSAPGPDAAEALLAVVAEKTGYPRDMLQLDMDLESDLGVDSIKRVEILAAFESAMPALAKADRQQLSSLRTLREIVAALPGQSAAAPAVPQTATASVTQDFGAPLPKSMTASKPEPMTPPVTIVDLSHGGMAMPNSLGRYALTRVNAPATGMSMNGLFGARVHVIGDTPVATALVLALKSRGVTAILAAPTPDCTALIDLGGLQSVTSADQAMAIQAQSFAHARTVARPISERGGLYVTVQDTGGAFGLSGHSGNKAWLSGYPALVKTAALEWPKASLRAIDIDMADRSADAVAEAITNELLAGGGEIEVGLSARGERTTLQSILKPVRPSMSVLATGDVVLVSGGARGVTAACLVEWARQQKLRFVLLGRTALADEPAVCAGIDDEAGLKRVLLGAAMASRESITPSELNARVRQVLANREVRGTLAAITSAGAEAHYLPVDVGNTALLGQALQRVRSSLGPISALVHAAGVLADKRIADKTDAQFDAVFGTKVLGLDALLSATRDDPLKLLAVFSSVSARCGNTGQADYAMANEVIAKVARAEARRRPGLRVKSFGWGPWEGGMVSPHLKARFAELGVPMIPLDVGARMFVDELRDARADDVELVLGGEPRPEALLSDGADARVQSVEVQVNQDSHAYLGGHAVDGEPVLPAVLAAEWFARAAASLRPGLRLKALHDLRVLKGVRLDRFTNGGQRFRVEARVVPGKNGQEWLMSLVDQQDQVRYSARAELGSEAPRGASKVLPELATQAWDGAPLYDQLLFHRGAFELIKTLDGVSDDGAIATLHGVDAARWQAEPWQFDVAALDAGMQMAVLLGQRMLGAPNLPTAIGELRRYAETPTAGPLRATAYRRKHGTNDMMTDIVFVDAQGRRFAELIGVHNIALSRPHWSAKVA